MKKTFVAAVFVLVSSVFAVGTLHAMDVSIDGGVGIDVKERTLLGEADYFTSHVGRVFCFTKVLGIEEPGTISHVWYFGDNVRARVDLPVRSISWRTYSSKIIQPHEVGPWHVDVISANGQVLGRYDFEVVAD